MSHTALDTRDRPYFEALDAEHETSSGAAPFLPAPPAPPLEPPGNAQQGRSGGTRRPGRATRWIAALTAALVLAGGGYALRAATEPAPTVSTTSATTATQSTSAGTGDVSALVSRAERAVVKITSRVTEQANAFQPASTGMAVGTGFVVASDGLILTNYHVVEGASSITVSLNDGRTYTGRVVAQNPAGDLAVVKIDASGLATLALGDSSTIQAGQPVVAIGYALDLKGSPTVTTGIVSSTGRTIQVLDENGANGPVVRTYRNMLQTSAAINSGNSGGPLLNSSGQVIGIDSAGASSADNIGFAIPVDQAKALIASVE